MKEFFEKFNLILIIIVLFLAGLALIKKDSIYFILAMLQLQILLINRR